MSCSTVSVLGRCRGKSWFLEILRVEVWRMKSEFRGLMELLMRLSFGGFERFDLREIHSY
jgi:hypothetical protein